MQKHSWKREAILSALKETDIHPSAEWIYSQLKPQIPDLSLATVYRNLSAFVKSGQAITVATVKGQERYDGFTEPHTHFVCSCCGAVLDLDYSPAEDMAELASAGSGLTITGHALTFFGRCGNCENQEIS